MGKCFVNYTLVWDVSTLFLVCHLSLKTKIPYIMIWVRGRNPLNPDDNEQKGKQLPNSALRDKIRETQKFQFFLSIEKWVLSKQPPS